MRIIIESLLAFVFVLGVLIFIHELGHFLMARILKIKVKVFSLGFGYRVYGFKVKDTDYRVSLVPLGGYVKLSGDAPDEHDPLDKDQFLSRPRLQRFLVIVMGAAFNIVLAILLMTFIYMHGIEVPSLPSGAPVVDTVDAGSPAEEAGIESGDRIMKLDGREVTSLGDFMQSIFLRPNSTADLVIQRNGQIIEKTVDVIEDKDSKYRLGYTGIAFRIPYQITSVTQGSPAEKGGLRAKDRIVGINGEYIEDIHELISRIRSNIGEPLVLIVKRDSSTIEKVVTPADKNGKGDIGIGLGYATEIVKKNLPGAFTESLKFAYSNATLIFITLKNLIRGGLSLRVFSGPIEIASFSGESYRQGPIYFIFFIAVVSLQLGIVNLLPIPVLDGGHILILLLEGIARRDFNVRMKEIIIQIGLVFLIVFAAIIIYFDIIKRFFS